jgi:hypothetical protein
MSYPRRALFEPPVRVFADSPIHLIFLERSDSDSALTSAGTAHAGISCEIETEW